jgi:hypothetical protein
VNQRGGEMIQDALFDIVTKPRSGPERHLGGIFVPDLEVLARQDGQERALRAVGGDYKADFAQAIDYLSHHFTAPQIGPKAFTIDDVIELIGLPSEGQNKNNAVGALMAGAAKRGLIRAIGYTESNRAGSHKRAVRLWEGVK